MSIFDILLLLVIGLAAVRAVMTIRRRRKQGKNCGGNCSQCSGCKN